MSGSVRFVVVCIALALLGSCGEPRSPAPGERTDDAARGRAVPRAGGVGEPGGRDERRGPPITGHRSTLTNDYESSILEWRRTREAFFRTDPRSPVPPALRATFAPPRYYPVDPTWRLRLPVLEYENPRTLRLVTNTGEARALERLARVEFIRDGKPVVLHLYREIGDDASKDSFWVPFVDAGAVRGETYPAGRYLEAERQPDGTVVLDFNLAYNPYCAYGLDASCPITPRENHLPVAVRAGERGFLHG